MNNAQQIEQGECSRFIIVNQLGNHSREKSWLIPHGQKTVHRIGL